MTFKKVGRMTELVLKWKEEHITFKKVGRMIELV